MPSEERTSNPSYDGVEEAHATVSSDFEPARTPITSASTSSATGSSTEDDDAFIYDCEIEKDLKLALENFALRLEKGLAVDAAKMDG
ncbi:hypothetical protein CAEBREN_09976 [Caenorhabditis brenneri]|uniref:Uncharacterized protein n=1 Tax=Caenorhabditis brenneri TaxID=135651 RepID=G0NS28_CAEBE|nr:hypothetical protein CAEBREN_09976 [Caenorhabditis brenneri]